MKHICQTNTIESMKMTVYKNVGPIIYSISVILYYDLLPKFIYSSIQIKHTYQTSIIGIMKMTVYKNVYM